MTRAALVVLAKELRETLRDRRTLFMMVVLPTLLYPALFLAMEQIALFGQRTLGERPAVVAVSGAEPALLDFLRADTALRLLPADGASPGAVRAGTAEAAVVLPHVVAGSRTARVWFDAADERSQRARDLVGARLAAWGDTLLARRLAAEGLPADFATPLAVADSSVATAREAGGYALGRFLPVLLILMTLLGTFYPAIDLAAGEKERGTLETLLTAPVPAAQIVAGKFAAVALVGLAAALANLGSMLLTFQTGVFRFARAADLQFALPWDAALLVVAGLVPLAVLFAAVFLGIAVRAQSFKEAQNALTPVQLAATLPILVVTLPGIAFTPLLAAVPVVGLALWFRELMAGGAPLLPSLVAFAASLGWAALALAFAARAFGREDVLFGGGAGESPSRGGRGAAWWAAWRSGPARLPTPGEAMVFVAAVGLLFFHGSPRLVAALGEGGIVAGSALLLGLPAVVFALAGPWRPREVLALRPVSPRAMAGALLVALGGVPLGWMIGWLQLKLLSFDRDADLLRRLEALVTADDAARFLWLLVVVALTPAVCEELVFRGVLLQGLRSRLRGWTAVLLSAAVFGAFHLSFETAIRFVPTMWIGLLVGWVAWRTRSVLAGMGMHFVNNAVAVAVVSVAAVRAPLLGPAGEPRWWVVALAPLVLGAGVMLVLRGTTGADDDEPKEEARW